MATGLFFHPEGERGPARARREARAKQVCHSCPVMEQCRRHALSVQEPYGVWGGLSKSERDEMLRGPRKARPGSPTPSDQPPRAPGSAWNNHAGPVSVGPAEGEPGRVGSGG